MQYLWQRIKPKTSQQRCDTWQPVMRKRELNIILVSSHSESAKRMDTRTVNGRYHKTPVTRRRVVVSRHRRKMHRAGPSIERATKVRTHPKESRPIPWLRRRAAGRAARDRAPPPPTVGGRERDETSFSTSPSPLQTPPLLASSRVGGSAHPFAETATKAASAFTDAARGGAYDGAGRRPHPGRLALASPTAAGQGLGQPAGPWGAWARASPHRGNSRRARKL